MEEVEKNYEGELQKKSDTVQCYIQRCTSNFDHHPHLFCLCLSGLSSPLFLPPQVSSLQEKLHSARLVCQSSSEQNLQLQLSLQQQQTMLTESTAHISELEESQSRLQTQVS